jgi:hypothetical protein
MAERTCEVCGKGLNKWNHAWGTKKCSGCAKGRSASGKVDDVKKHLDGFLSLEEILQSPWPSFFGKVSALVVIINSLGLWSHILLYRAGFVSLFAMVLPPIIVFKVGGSIGKQVFERSNLVDVQRWRTLWRSNIAGFIVGFFVIIWVNDRPLIPQISDTTPRTLTSAQETVVLLCSIVCIFGAFALAAVVTRATDRGRKAWVTQKWGELHPETSVNPPSHAN